VVQLNHVSWSEFYVGATHHDLNLVQIYDQRWTWFGWSEIWSTLVKRALRVSGWKFWPLVLTRGRSCDSGTSGWHNSVSIPLSRASLSSWYQLSRGAIRAIVVDAVADADVAVLVMTLNLSDAIPLGRKCSFVHGKSMWAIFNYDVHLFYCCLLFVAWRHILF